MWGSCNSFQKLSAAEKSLSGQDDLVSIFQPVSVLGHQSLERQQMMTKMRVDFEARTWYPVGTCLDTSTAECPNHLQWSSVPCLKYSTSLKKRLTSHLAVSLLHQTPFTLERTDLNSAWPGLTIFGIDHIYLFLSAMPQEHHSGLIMWNMLIQEII